MNKRMEKQTLKSPIQPAIFLIAWLLLYPLWLSAQENTSNRSTGATDEATAKRPESSDAASQRLIDNYLAVTGGREAHRALRNVVAEGTIKESTLERRFTLIETADGKRHLTYSWSHLGRKYREVHVHDGVQTWKQVLEPKKQDAQVYGGIDGAHFGDQRWLLQPFTLPALADYTFEYAGTSKVGGRSTYLIKGYGHKNRQSWFYFDQEKFLLIRWGGEGRIAGVKESMDYRATQFKAVANVLLPSQIDLLAENAAYGRIQFERIEANQDLGEFSFLMPRSTAPTLRQRPVNPN